MFRSGVYDLRTAKQAGTTTTGHALPPPNPEGPFPLNLFMAPGDADVDQMIASTERGLLVTRFHYTNIVHPVESTITGMTRDGTFLIEDGTIAHPVKNLRFTQSILEALTGHRDDRARHRARERVLLLGQPRPRAQGLVVQLQRAFGPLRPPPPFWSRWPLRTDRR